jgi:hypothetical protein
VSAVWAAETSATGLGVELQPIRETNSSEVSAGTSIVRRHGLLAISMTSFLKS